LGLGPTFGSGGNGDINAEQAELAQTIRVPETYTSTIYAYDFANVAFLSTLNIVPGLTASTIAVSSFTIGNAQFQNFAASTITASTITSGPITATTLLAPNGINVGASVLLSANIPNLATQSIINLSSVNGSPYPPPASGVPAGMIMAYAGPGAPLGWIACSGGVYDGTNPVYAALFAAIGLTWGGSGTNFFAPDLRQRTIFGAIKDGATPAPYPNTSYFVNVTAGTFSAIAGSSTPFGLPASQVLSVTSTDGEIRVGMQIRFAGETTIPVITNIFNYTGGKFSGTSPNTVIVCVDNPFSQASILPGNFFTVYPNNAPGNYSLGNTTNTNYTTQTALQVAQHTHPNGFGAGGINALNTSNNPIQGQNTGANNTTCNYTLAGTGFTIPVVTANTPSMGVANWVIKL
jgi:hypothetical protein